MHASRVLSMQKVNGRGRFLTRETKMRGRRHEVYRRYLNWR